MKDLIDICLGTFGALLILLICFVAVGSLAIAIDKWKERRGRVTSQDQKDEVLCDNCGSPTAHSDTITIWRFSCGSSVGCS
jgi:hypothetical protein